MTLKSQAEQIAAANGAKIEDNWNDDGRTLEAVAPEGREWADGPSVLIANYGGTWGPKAEAWQDLIDRMSYGLS